MDDVNAIVFFSGDDVRRIYSLNLPDLIHD